MLQVSIPFFLALQVICTLSLPSLSGLCKRQRRSREKDAPSFGMLWRASLWRTPSSSSSLTISSRGPFLLASGSLDSFGKRAERVHVPFFCREYYSPKSFLCNEYCANALINLLYEVNQLRFEFNHTDVDIDNEWVVSGQKRPRSNSITSMSSVLKREQSMTDTQVTGILQESEKKLEETKSQHALRLKEKVGGNHLSSLSPKLASTTK